MTGINWGSIFTLRNIIDILAVWGIIYYLLLLLKGTRAIQLLRGLLVISIIKVISWFFNLTTLSWMMDQFITWGVVAIIIIFQPEIRRGLEKLGSRSDSLIKKRNNKKAQTTNTIKALDKAIQYLSKRRIGALITIQRGTGLDEYIETGTPLDADISSDLLINTFIPNTPLHDGALIITNNKVAAAATYLPLSQSKGLPSELGTRHRAAMGISEVTDAVTIVISEETGKVSITRNNEMLRDLDRKEYLKYLNHQLMPIDNPHSHSPLKFLTNFIHQYILPNKNNDQSKG